MSKLIGSIKELQALNFLKKQGLSLLCRNYQCRLGEIDLIMKKQDTLVFVEVRYRGQDHYGSATESVDFFKQQKLFKSAQHFLQVNPAYQDFDCRFDVIAFSKDNKEPEWIRSAF